ncbi:hypothetical protein RTH46_21870 [Pseudomonas sp. zfem004]|uniref:hypothetical protein n=1 Tax=Pseudomonas sp. zfem004 TaxID=3078199 RepID=UPI00292A1F1E|nr:hypothetical protein [Pseudomonas sp. zfem004]MDU9405139.1 hypothetical protein [Pseudomonas sp. zfem004]
MRLERTFALVQCMCLLCALAVSTSARSETIDAVFDEMKQLAEQRWHIPATSLQKVEGNQIATGVDGNILVGKDFLAHFTRDLPENQVQSALRFVMLHELVHVAQSHDIPDVSPADPSRKAFECQADMLAATATLETQIMGISLSDKTGAGGKELLATARQFKQLGAHAEQQDVASKTLSGHLDKRERALAVQFGLIRAMHTWMTATNQQGERAEQARAAIQNLLGPNDISDERAWSMTLCNAITRTTQTAVNAIAMNTRMDVNDDTIETDENYRIHKKYNYTITNTAPYTVAINLIVLSGSYPKGADDRYEDYVISDAAYSSVEIPPRSKGVLSGTYTFASYDPDQRSGFTWDYPLDKHALVSATYLGNKVATPNCNNNWKNLGSSAPEQMASALVRIGMAAKKNFADIVADPVFPGISDDTFHSKIAVPGAADVTLHQQVSNPFAIITLYSGDSLQEAIKVYEATAGAFKKLCDADGVEITSDEKPDDPERSLTFENLTGYSRANLSLDARKKDKTANAPLEYSVSWFISPTD